ncbi:MAG: hypothetical protein U0M10_07855 [Oscillospiraceae bacterium]|nr:hypothetical protein [Oscillospiraceae bacterium]
MQVDKRYFALLYDVLTKAAKEFGEILLMYVLSLLLLLLLNMLIVFSLAYCGDELDLWLDGKELTMPRLEDVGSVDDDGKEKYIERVIAPAYCYFKLVNDLRERQKDIENTNLSWIVLDLVSAILMGRIILTWGVITSRLLVLLVTIAICALSNLVAFYVYEKSKLKLHNFCYSCALDKETAKQADEIASFGISEETAENICMIRMHDAFLQKNKESIIFRASIRKILFVVGGIVYLLFFFRVPD